MMVSNRNLRNSSGLFSGDILVSGRVWNKGFRKNNLLLVWCPSKFEEWTFLASYPSSFTNMETRAMVAWIQFCVFFAAKDGCLHFGFPKNSMFFLFSWSCFNTKTCKPHVFFWSWEGVFTVILVNVTGIFVGNNEPPRKELEVMSVLILDHFEGDVFDTFDHSKSPICILYNDKSRLKATSFGEKDMFEEPCRQAFVTSKSKWCFFGHLWEKMHHPNPGTRFNLSKKKSPDLLRPMRFRPCRFSTWFFWLGFLIRSLRYTWRSK